MNWYRKAQEEDLLGEIVRDFSGNSIVGHETGTVSREAIRKLCELHDLEYLSAETNPSRDGVWIHLSMAGMWDVKSKQPSKAFSESMEALAGHFRSIPGILIAKVKDNDWIELTMANSVTVKGYGNKPFKSRRIWVMAESDGGLLEDIMKDFKEDHSSSNVMSGKATINDAMEGYGLQQATIDELNFVNLSGKSLIHKWSIQAVILSRLFRAAGIADLSPMQVMDFCNGQFNNTVLNMFMYHTLVLLSEECESVIEFQKAYDWAYDVYLITKPAFWPDPEVMRLRFLKYRNSILNGQFRTAQDNSLMEDIIRPMTDTGNIFTEYIRLNPMRMPNMREVQKLLGEYDLTLLGQCREGKTLIWDFSYGGDTTSFHESVNMLVDVLMTIPVVNKVFVDNRKSRIHITMIDTVPT